MSGSEDKQNNPLSQRDREAGEMAQELMDMAMYEDGMNFEEMKAILQFVNESKDMAGIKSNNRSSQEVSGYSTELIEREVIGKNNSHRELSSDENSLPQPSFSYRQQSGRSSPTTSGRKSASEVLPADEEILSIGSPEMFDINNKEEEEAEEAEKAEDDERRRQQNRKPITNNHESKFDKLLKETKEKKKKIIILNDNDKDCDDDEVNENRSQQSTIKQPWRILSGSSSQNSQNSNSQSGDMNIENNNKWKKNERLERWKLDPTISVIEERDVPLKEINRPDVLEERIPYRFCHDKKILDKNIGDKVLTVLTRTLEEVADIWRIKHRDDDDSYEIQWGSPIKVGANNRSLDKKPVIEETDSSERSEYNFRKNPASDNTPLRRNTERNCKRKAVENIRDLVNDDNDIDSDDEDKDDMFEKVKKSKKNDEPWQPTIKNNLNKSERNFGRQDKMFNNLHNSNNKPETSSMIDDYDSDEFDNDDLKTLHRKSQNKDKEIAGGLLSSPLEEYPRRIVPPNPAKPKIIRRGKKNGEKSRKKSPVRKTTQTVLEKNKDSGISIGRGRGRGRGRNQIGKRGRIHPNLSEDEIQNELEMNEPLEIDLDEEIEIKPMPIKGGLASKLQQGTSFLLENKKAEERLRQARIQDEEELQTAERLRKEERENSRYLKEKEEEREREIKEQQIKAKEAAWKKSITVRDRERRRRQAQEKNRNADSTKGVLLMDEDEDENNGDNIVANINARQQSMEERVQCPICQLEFSKKEIQDHAADCNQFDNIDNEPGTGHSAAADDDELIITQDDRHECNVCSDFTTRDGFEYEEHVNNCLKKKKERNDASAGGEIIEVPSSPIRSFVPISQQVGSSINYADQFPGQGVNNNKQNFNLRTKRRR